MSIVTSLLLSNCKENLITRFFANEQTNFKGLFMFVDVAMTTALSYRKPKVWVANLLAAIFGDQRIKGFREKGEWNTRIKNCVQPH